MNKEHKDTVGRFGKGIGEILVENFSLSTENLEEALKEQQKDPGKKLGEILVEKNM